VPDNHPLALRFAVFGPEPIQALWARADGVLAVGTDFDETTTGGWRLPPPRGLVQIDADPAQIGRNYPVDVGLAGDARMVLEQLLAVLGGYKRETETSWMREAGMLRRNLRAAAENSEGLALVGAMGDALGREGISTGDAAGVGAWQLLHLPVYGPRTLLFPLGFGTLGFGLPAALGAQVAYPRRRVICLCGDGGFQFTLQELATAVQHELPVVTIVVNDCCYRAIRRGQEQRYDGRIIAADLKNPDFPRLAEAYGATGLRVAAVDELSTALVAAFEAGKPAVIEVPGPVQEPIVRV
jgi:acetolactate synthase-1/2/3 large subunit